MRVSGRASNIAKALTIVLKKKKVKLLTNKEDEELNTDAIGGSNRYQYRQRPTEAEEEEMTKRFLLNHLLGMSVVHPPRAMGASGGGLCVCGCE